MSLSKDPAVTDRLSDFTQDKRTLLLMPFALVIGVLSTFSAWCLINLIGFISNLVFYQTFSTNLIPLTHHHLSMTRVQDIMEQSLQTIPDMLSMHEFSQMLALHSPAVAKRHASLILNRDGDLVGLITRGDVIRAIEAEADMSASVVSFNKVKLIVTYPDELLKDAVHKMVEEDVGRLPVVKRENPAKLIGYIGRSAIIQAQMKQFQDEHQRESRWSSIF